jgi:hypothetical protein
LSTGPGMPRLAEQAAATPSGPLLVVRAVGRPAAPEVALAVTPLPAQPAYVIVDPHVPTGAPAFIGEVAGLLGSAL